jgi:hypothetical protein
MRSCTLLWLSLASCAEPFTFVLRVHVIGPFEVFKGVQATSNWQTALYALSASASLMDY